MTVALKEWFDALQTREGRCFWTGPRPMRTGDPRDQLIGREGDVRDFADLVREVNLIVLSGESGAGKSSLLNAGIHPQLNEDGFVVLICSDWSADPGRQDASHDPAAGLKRTEKFLASKLAPELPAGIKAGAGFLRELNEKHGDGAVIILDQFEELIRHKPELYDEVRQWVEHAVDQFDVRIVISLREEFKHRLRDLAVGPFKRADFYLHPLRSRALISRVIQSGRRPDHSAGVIRDDAADMLLDLWERAGGGQPWSGIGMLHLQALLYVFWRDATAIHADDPESVPDDVVVTADHVWAALNWPGVARQKGDFATVDAVALFKASLARAVTYRLSSCRNVFLGGASSDPVLADGVVTVISRMADHLASGGYKVDQEERHLAQLVLDEELMTLEFSGDLDGQETDAKLFRAFAERVRSDGSWLTARRDEFVSGDPDLFSAVTGSQGSNSTAGPMMGFSRSAVLIEELRRYFFALEWLVASDLVRRTSPEGGTTMIALVHDGFGRGLSEWAAGNAEDARGATSRLTATVGKTLTWEPSVHAGEPDPFDGSRADQGIRYANLRWRSSRIAEVRFRKVVFINCDFRWTSFDKCEFEGVTFVNCLLDGVEFSNCGVIGGVSEAPRVPPGERPLPSFVVRGAELVRLLDRYRESSISEGSDVEKRKLISWTAGLPAVPVSPALEQDLKNGLLSGFQHQEWTPESSGLMICGGRLSSLMFAHCHGPLGADGTPEAMGTVALRHVAGTSLEFGEQGAGSIQLADVAIRGLTISPPVWVSTDEVLSGDREHRIDVGHIRLEVLDSQLQNVWLSTPLRGQAEIRNSVLWQFFNANGQEDFTVALDGDSPNAGVVNCPPGGLPREPAWFETQCAAKPDVDAAAKKVDYQSLGNLLKFLPDPPEE